MNKQELSQLNLSEMDDGEFQAMVRKKLLGENDGEKSIRNRAEVRQVVVEAPNVESKINDGYLLIGWYPDGNKAVLQPSEFT